MNRIWRAIKKFIFMKPVKAQNKRDWVHLNARSIAVNLAYISESGASDYHCRYKTVEGRTNKRWLRKDLDYHRIQLTPRSRKAVVLVWKWETWLGMEEQLPPYRYVVHLDKNSRKEEYI